jgi:enediyne biosynthesis protein E8
MDAVRGLVGEELSRRDLLRHATLLGTASLIASAVPVAERILAADPALAAVPTDEATMQAFADTVIPGRKAATTDLGDEIHPDAIAGVDDEPGAVEADVMRLYHHPLTGFDALEPAFLADLSTRSLQQGGPFLGLDFEQRSAVLLQALSFDNPDRVLYEAAAAVPFTAFCAAAIHETGTSKNASGYRVMGYPGAAPQGYRRYSYGRKLARDFTKKGYLK